MVSLYLSRLITSTSVVLEALTPPLYPASCINLSLDPWFVTSLQLHVCNSYDTVSAVPYITINGYPFSSNSLAGLCISAATVVN